MYKEKNSAGVITLQNTFYFVEEVDFLVFPSDAAQPVTSLAFSVVTGRAASEGKQANCC